MGSGVRDTGICCVGKSQCENIILTLSGHAHPNAARHKSAKNVLFLPEKLHLLLISIHDINHCS